MKNNLLEVTHITNDGIFHPLLLDLDKIVIHGISELPIEKRCSIFWHVIGVEDENTTHISESYDWLKERIYGIKKQ